MKWRGGSTFSPSSEYTCKDFRVPLCQKPIHKRFLPRSLLNQWIHLVLYQTEFDKLTKLIREYREAILRQRDEVKITDQSEALFKQKWWFKTKTNDRVASRLEIGL